MFRWLRKPSPPHKVKTPLVAPTVSHFTLIPLDKYSKKNLLHLASARGFLFVRELINRCLRRQVGSVICLLEFARWEVSALYICAVKWIP